MVQVIEDEWECKRCGHRMADHIMHHKQCIQCMGECQAFLLMDKDYETVKKLKGEYYIKEEKNPIKKFLMRIGLMK